MRRVLILILLAFCALASPALAQLPIPTTLMKPPASGGGTVTLESSTVDTWAGGATTRNVSHTSGGTCKFGVVQIITYENWNRLSGVTWNGVSMTEAVAAKVDDTTTSDLVSVWTLNNVATGTQTIAINYTANSQYGSYNVVTCWAGTNASSPLGNVTGVHTPGDTSPVSASITMSSGSVALSGMTHEQTSTVTSGSGQTELVNTAWGGNSVASSYKTNATSMDYTYSGGGATSAHAIIEIKP